MSAPRIWFIVFMVLCLAGAVLTELAHGVQFNLINMVFMDMSSRLRYDGVITQEQWSRLCDDAVPPIRRLVGVTHGITFLWLLVAGLNAVAFIQSKAHAKPSSGTNNGRS